MSTFDQASERPATGSGFEYDAFASYSSDPDYYLVRDIESFLESFHRLKTPAGESLRKLTIAVDASALSATSPPPADDGRRPAGRLTEVILDRLRRSRYLLIFWSERTRDSRWVDLEVRWFLENRSEREVLLAVTGGADPATNPEALFSRTILDAKIHLKNWYDFRAYDPFRARSWLRVRDFDDQRTQLAADLLGYRAEEVQPYWLRQQRRRHRQVVGASVTVAVTMTVLAGLAVSQRNVAEARRAEAERETHRADALLSNTLSAEAGLGLAKKKLSSLRLLAEARLRADLPRARALSFALRPPELTFQGSIRTGLPSSSVGISADARLLHVASGARISLYDLRTGRPTSLGGPTPPGANANSPLALSPDGSLLAYASGRDVVLWDVPRGRAARTLTGHREEPVSLAFHPEGRTLASGSGSEQTILWDVATGRPLHSFENLNPLNTVTFDLDGRSLAVQTVTGGVLLFDPDGDFQSPYESLPDSESESSGVIPVVAPAFSPAGGVLASAYGNAVRLWDLRADKPSAVLRGHSASVLALTFSPDGRTLITGSEDKSVRVWDVADGRELLHLEGHTGPVRGLAFRADGREVASASDDGTVRLWRVGDLPDFDHVDAQAGDSHPAVFHPDGRLIALAAHDGSLRLWDIFGERETAHTGAARGAIWDLRYNREGTVLASLQVGRDDAIRFWDGSTLRPLRSSKQSYTLCLAFSPTGQHIAWGGMNKVALHDVRSGEVRELAGHRYEVRSLAFSPDGKLLASGGADHTVLVRDVESGREIRKLQTGAWVFAVAFSHNGSYLAGGSGFDFDPNPAGGFMDDISPRSDGVVGVVRMWDVKTWAVARDLERHRGHISALAFSPDDALLASGGDDATVRLWDVETGVDYCSMQTAGLVHSLSFSPVPSPPLLAVSSDKGPVRLWGGLVPNTLDEAERVSGLTWDGVAVRPLSAEREAVLTSATPLLVPDTARVDYYRARMKAQRRLRRLIDIGIKNPEIGEIAAKPLKNWIAQHPESRESTEAKDDLARMLREFGESRPAVPQSDDDKKR